MDRSSAVLVRPSRIDKPDRLDKGKQVVTLDSPSTSEDEADVVPNLQPPAKCRGVLSSWEVGSSLSAADQAHQAVAMLIDSIEEKNTSTNPRAASEAGGVIMAIPENKTKVPRRKKWLAKFSKFGKMHAPLFHKANFKGRLCIRGNSNRVNVHQGKRKAKTHPRSYGSCKQRFVSPSSSDGADSKTEGTSACQPQRSMRQLLASERDKDDISSCSRKRNRQPSCFKDQITTTIAALGELLAQEEDYNSTDEDALANGMINGIEETVPKQSPK